MGRLKRQCLSSSRIIHRNYAAGCARQTHPCLTDELSLCNPSISAVAGR